MQLLVVRLLDEGSLARRGRCRSLARRLSVVVADAVGVGWRHGYRRHIMLSRAMQALIIETRLLELALRLDEGRFLMVTVAQVREEQPIARALANRTLFDVQGLVHTMRWPTVPLSLLRVPIVTLVVAARRPALRLHLIELLLLLHLKLIVGELELAGVQVAALELPRAILATRSLRAEVILVSQLGDLTLSLQQTLVGDFNPLLSYTFHVLPVLLSAPFLGALVSLINLEDLLLDRAISVPLPVLQLSQAQLLPILLLHGVLLLLRTVEVV